VFEYGERVQIDRACHTDDPEVDRKFHHWIVEIEPAMKPLVFQLKQKYIAASAAAPDASGRFAVLDREWTADIALFRPENVSLEARTQELIAEYDRIQGGILVDFRGGTYSPQQMARFQEEPDPAIREAAWRAAEERRARDEAALDRVFDDVLEVRAAMARHAGCEDFRAYMWRALHRFDYTPADCDAFADAIEQACVPLVHELDRKRAASLGLTALRPWDMAQVPGGAAGVDPLGRPALRPFEATDPGALVEKTARVFDRVDPSLGRQFRRLQPGRNLDLESRRGKRPGGFQSNLEHSRETFIFMNATGTQRDVDTMLHEAGHAFHAMATFDHVPLVFQRTPGAEFCEVASMSMELIGHPYLDEFYDDPSRGTPARAARQHLEGILRILPWIATVDQFQQWLYTHPGHSQGDRAHAWLTIFGRFFDGPCADWTGFEQVRRHRWQRQIHLYHYPFYYIEYGIAQLGAVQVWLNYRRDPRNTLDALLHAFSLGNTRPLPELFAAAGLRFDFSRATLAPLLRAIGDELGRLPA
jgi:oligoendopeptidase F